MTTHPLATAPRVAHSRHVFLAAGIAAAALLAAGCSASAAGGPTSSTNSPSSPAPVAPATAPPTPSPAATRAAVELPRPNGRYAVGVTDLPRFAMTAYYPARAGTGRGPRPYAGLELLGYYGITAQEIAGVRGHAQVGAAPLAGPAPWPVAVFAPGGGSFVELSTSLAEDLASHGYVVITVQPDASVESGLTGGTPPTDAREVQLLEATATAARRDLVTHALDLVRDPLTARLVGPLDPRRVAVGGHSLGGSTAFDVSLTDRRIAAAFDLDGSLFGPAATTTLTVPAMVILSGLDASTVSSPTMSGFTVDVARRTFARLATAHDIVTVVLRGARHFDLTDLPAITPALPAAIRATAVDGAGTIGRDGTLITNRLVQRFLDVALGGRPSLPTVAYLIRGLPAAEPDHVR
jgi:predicted dienelactone hydrolase